MTGSDYQWQRPTNISGYFQSLDVSLVNDVYNRIEYFFSKRFDNPAVLMPSGRAALSAIFEYYRASRKDIIFAPKFSSACIWNAIGLVSNPTCILTDEVTILVAVHKWGHQVSLDKAYGAKIIEDSVDSIVVSSNGIFSLNGEFEIFSLPKIIGSISGAIVLPVDGNFVKWSRHFRTYEPPLILRQSKLKHERAQHGTPAWDSQDLAELFNRGLDVYCLQNIMERMTTLERAIVRMKRRLDECVSKFSPELIIEPAKRLPCLIPLDANVYECISPEHYMIRQFDFNSNLNSPLFKSAILLPIHDGISDIHFNQLVSGLRVRQD
jgi:putative PLP-dependent aminotransferase (TIGR04422 family)